MTLQTFLSEKTRNARDTAPVEWPTWTQGQTEPVTEEAYDYYLDVLPPRWMNRSAFAYGEGAGSFTLFWQLGSNYYARHLTMEETQTFCSLSRTRLNQ